jgi:alkylresorcinol/alkylpyrone synthase
MRYINDIFTADLGDYWDNAALLQVYEGCVERLPLPDDERAKLRDFVRFQLVGERARRTVVPDWGKLSSFAGRAAAFEEGADQAVDRLAEQIAPAAEAAGVTFDAVLATTATGNLMPGISYRIAHRLGGLVRPDTLMVDLANVGCTGGLKALNLARSFDDSIRNTLIVAVEVPTTLVDTTGTAFDLWQGNCTFGDGAAALWVSSDPEQGSTALALEEINYRQRADTGLGLIRWGYRDYYSFALADQKTFDQDVRQFVVDALSEAEAGWKEEPRWAIHPAGILLLMKISRRLGIPGEAIQPSVEHYREYSNMSSASVLQILKRVAAGTPEGSAINLLSMGAGFNVIYGRTRRVR